MQKAGVTRFIEGGPGKVLWIRQKIDKTNSTCKCIEDQANLQALLENWINSREVLKGEKWN